MDIKAVRPKALKPGDAIAIIAPAGPIEQRDDFYRGVAALEAMGFRVRYRDRIFETRRYLAGTDEERAEELMASIEDEDIKAIVSLRGGYGCSRLIPLLDRNRLRDHCKILMGFSDLTTLHLFFRRQFGWVTFHGPMATSAALGDIRPQCREHLMALWTNPDYRASFSFPEQQTWVPGAAEGELVGGCLSLIVASLGTPYEPDTEGKILFIEDLGEPPYRIDRMLTQLLLARKLDGLKGVVLGSFQDCQQVGADYSVEEVLNEILVRLQIPVIANFPSGHGTENWVLPLGARVRLDSAKRQLHCLESCVEP